MHNGKAQLRPNVALMSHGRASAFVRRDQIPAIAEIVAALGTEEGKLAMLKADAAVAEVRSQSVDEADHRSFIEYANLKRTNLGAITTLEQMSAPASQALVVEIPNYGDSQNGTELVRTLDGPGTLHMVMGKPYLLDEATGALWPAHKVQDADTGVDLYERVDRPHALTEGNEP